MILDIAKKLIEFPTTSANPEATNDCVTYLEELFKAGQITTKRYISNQKLSLIATSTGTVQKKYDLILNGHLDVVPANYENAFDPTVKDGKLYGRGAMDMKSEIAVMCQILIDSQNQPHSPSICLMLTSDEEIGGFNGVPFLLDECGFESDCAIVPDDGNSTQITLNQKGVLHIKVKSLGTAAHGSRVWLGDNAITKLMSFYHHISAQIPPTAPNDRWLATINLGRISGGLAANIVPESAEMWLDFRYPYPKDYSKIISLLDTGVKEFPGISYEILINGAPMNTDQQNPHIQKFFKTMSAAGFNFSFDNRHGASDARFFTNHHIPVIMFRPESSEAHIDHEWVDLKSLDNFYLQLKTFVFSQ